MPSGLETARLGLGLAEPGAGSALARGCGATVFCCATRTAVASTTAATAVKVMAVDLIRSLPRGPTPPPSLLADHMRQVPVVLFADALDQIRVGHEPPGQLDIPRLRIGHSIVNRDVDVY